MNDQAQNSQGPANVWTIEELNASLENSEINRFRTLVPGGGREPPDEWTFPPTSPQFPGHRPTGPVIITSPSACRRFPVDPTSSTNDRFIFLSEIGVDCLQQFLTKVHEETELGKYGGGTLIIDQPVTLTEPLRLPHHFTLAGVGIHGEGRIKFKGKFTGPAIVISEIEKGISGGKVILRDLAIEGPDVKNKMDGFKVGSVQFVSDLIQFRDRALGRFQLQRVRISKFGGYGIQGGLHTYSVWIDDCELSDNGSNIQLVGACNTWRIRNCVIKNAARWGLEVGLIVSIIKEAVINVKGALSDASIVGCKFEGNHEGAIVVHTNAELDPPAESSFGVFIVGNSFKNNNKTAVKVEQIHSGVRIVSNLFHPSEGISLPQGEGTLLGEGESIHPLATHLGFNVSLDSDPQFKALNRLSAPFPKAMP